MSFIDQRERAAQNDPQRTAPPSSRIYHLSDSLNLKVEKASVWDGTGVANRTVSQAAVSNVIIRSPH